MKIVKKTVFFSFLLVILFALIIYVIAFFPKITFNKSHEISVYDTNDELLITTHFENEGQYLELKDINEEFLIAFIASEDKDFYDHNGFSFKGIIRALYNNIMTFSSQGGSTISQQLSRSLFLSNDKSIIRKIKEAIITINIEKNYDKKEILEQYLNTIYLGHNIYGISQASNYYFSKDNKDLTTDEVAMIVGIANAPNVNAPDINYDNAIIRRNYVLKQMNKLGYINDELLHKLINVETKININKSKSNNINNQLFYYIKNKLVELNLYNNKILANGIKVYTTIDKKIHEQTYEILSKNNNKDNSQSAIIILKPNSGDILSLFGGYDIYDEYNRAIYSIRPIGSTIKPLLYYLALKCNMSPLTYFDCSKTTFKVKGFEDYTPTNASNSYAKHKINMIEAIALSDNVYATKTLLYVGFNNFERILQKFDVDIDCVLSSSLGVDEMSLLKLASIYNCFASLGKYYTPRLISKITDYNDNILYSFTPKGKRLLSKSYVKVLNQLLTSPFDNNLIDYTTPTLLNYPTKTTFAAKTGSNESSLYTIGFNPNYTIAIYNGTDNNERLINRQICKKIFQEIANSINDENIWYSIDENIMPIKVNPIYGNNTSPLSTYWLLR